jgi:PAS domain-containing protein
MSKQEVELLQRALDRQVKARKQAEKILESKSKELYDTLHYLREDNNRLNGLLKEKTSELEGVFFNIPDPYLVINLEGQVVKMNQAAKVFLGFDIDQEDFLCSSIGASRIFNGDPSVFSGTSGGRHFKKLQD